MATVGQAAAQQANSPERQRYRILGEVFEKLKKALQEQDMSDRTLDEIASGVGAAQNIKEN